MKQAFTSFGIFLAVAVLSIAGAWEEFDLWLLDQRMERVEHAPTGDVVLVEIDAKTLRELDQWPLPRAVHADVTDALVSAGADQIAFDVDLSGETDAADNRALVRAFERAEGRVVLPIFFQRERSGERGSRIVVTRPRADFAQHVWLANVNVTPDADGRVRQASYGVWLEGEFFMSLSALLAGRANRDELFFYVNYSIEAQEIPRLSYADILRGRFDAAQVQGKKIIVGATAIELGDQIAVPNHGVMPGPLIQAMAFETLAQKLEIRRSAIWMVLPGLALIVFAGWYFEKRLSWRAYLVVSLLVLLALQGAGFVLFKHFAVDLETAAWSLAVLLLCAQILLSEISKQRVHILGQKRENEYRRLLMTNVVEGSTDAIIIADDDGKVELLNPVARRLFNVPNPGHSLRLCEVLPSGLLAHMEDGDGSAGEYVMRGAGKNGADTCLQYTVVKLQIVHGQARHAPLFRNMKTYTFHDVSARYTAEQAIRKAHLQEKTASRAKSEFIANISHELRTPLNAIIGFSELIASEIYGPLGDERYKGYIADVTGSGRNLLSVLNDILDISKIDSDDIEIIEDEIKVGAVVESCLSIVRFWKDAAHNQFTVDLRGPDCLIADPRLLKQMLTNLLSNAVKFSPNDGCITIRSAAASNGDLHLSVSDQGIGVSEDVLPRITEPFFQADTSLARAYEGTGLGLTLVKSFVELHGGALELESAPGAGMTATLIFPAARVLNEGGAAVFASA